MNKILAIVILVASFALAPNKTQNAHKPPPVAFVTPTSVSVSVYFGLCHTKLPPGFVVKCSNLQAPTNLPTPRFKATLPPTLPPPVATFTEMPVALQGSEYWQLLPQAIAGSELAVRQNKAEDLPFKRKLYEQLNKMVAYSTGTSLEGLTVEALKRIRQGIELVDKRRLQEGVDILLEIKKSDH